MQQQDNSNKDELHSIWLVKLIWDQKWLIGSFVGIVIILTWIATQFMTPLYQSTTVLYATNPKSNADVLDYQEFGWDVDSDRLIQVLESTRIRDSIIQQFNLIEHYGIDTSEQQWKSNLYRKYRDRITFNRTLSMAIEVKVKDQDPEIAAEIANEIASLGDEVKSDILKDNVHRALKSIENQFKTKKNEVEQLTEELVQMKAVSADEAVSKLQQKIKNKSARVEKIRNALNKLRSKHQVHDLKAQIDEVRTHLTEAQSKHFLETGKLDLYEERLSKLDTTRINTEARVKGSSKKLKGLKQQLPKMTRDNLRFSKLENALSLHMELLNDFKRRIQNITAAYEPSAQNVKLEKQRKAFEAAVTRLQEIKTKYEKALQSYNKPIPHSYVISEAEPIYKPVAPKTSFILIASAILSFMFITGLLAFTLKFKEA